MLINQGYTIEWSVQHDTELLNNLNEYKPSLIESISKLSEPNGLHLVSELNDFTDGEICRPRGSRRAYYWKYSPAEDVIAVKGTEIVSEQLESALQEDSESLLSSRPWSKFENFIYREQKAPLAMLFNEAFDEAMKGIRYQSNVHALFGCYEEAPLPLLVYKYNNKIVEKYKNTISGFIDPRARDLLFPLIDNYGLGGTVYHYRYLPTRARFGSSVNNNSLMPLSETDPILAIQNLVNIQARMLLAGYYPFAYEDHGIGQCIAPQNVTLRGGICDLGSLKSAKDLPEDGLKYKLLQSIGSLLTRSAYELLGERVDDIFYEFENPTPLMYQISAFIHDQLRTSIFEQAKSHSLNVPDEVDIFYGSGLEKIRKALGMKF